MCVYEGSQLGSAKCGEFPASLSGQVCFFVFLFFKPFLHQFKDSQYIKGKIELS